LGNSNIWIFRGGGIAELHRKPAMGVGNVTKATTLLIDYNDLKNIRLYLKDGVRGVWINLLDLERLLDGIF
jgi:hypothetical protein